MGGASSVSVVQWDVLPVESPAPVSSGRRCTETGRPWFATGMLPDRSFQFMRIPRSR